MVKKEMIAVTGATGHIGSNLVPVLLKQGYKVRILARSIRPWSRDWPVEITRGDILDPEVVKELVNGVSYVIHLAGMISISGDRTGMVDKVNRLGTQHVVAACLEAKVKRMIHFSSIHTFDPRPKDEVLDESRVLNHRDPTAYDRSKIAALQAVMEAAEKGLNAVVLCPTSVFGPQDHVPSLLGQAIRDISENNIPMLIPGGYDFVDVRDVADATLAALQLGASGNQYLLSGTYLTIPELARKIGTVGRVKVPSMVLPAWLLKLIIPFFLLSSRITGKPAVFTYESLRTLMEGNTRISSARARQELGYTTRNFERSLKDTLEWFRNNN